MKSLQIPLVCFFLLQLLAYTEGQCECQNGGTCLGEGGVEPPCECLPGYTGDKCGLDVDECGDDLPDPCNDPNTECVNGFGTFTCMCKTGSVCTGPCSPIPCQNGGTCTVTGSTFECACVSGFTGNTCNEGPCSPNPCQNGGTCTVTGSTFECACVSGFTGNTCNEAPLLTCLDVPCQNGGTCVNVDARYSCRCLPGFTGSDCERDVNECNNSPFPCHADATCTNSLGSYTCECKDGFNGDGVDNCIDTCPSRADADKKDCGFGGVTEVSCLQKGCCWEEVRGNFPWCFLRAIQTEPPMVSQCLASGSGRQDCAAQLDTIDLELCTARGCCYDEEGNRPICYRPTPIPSPCASSPCRNDGVCEVIGDTFVCYCTEYTGVLCETSLESVCASGPCLYGGTCQQVQILDAEPDFTCMCEVGYTGPTCEVDINECKTDPCHVSGECSNTVGTFACTCLDGFLGDGFTCEDACTAMPPEDRLDCGYVGISQTACEGLSQCCWDSSVNNAPWCFIRVIKTVAPPQEECTMASQRGRVDCAPNYPNIDETLCTNRGCCWDNVNVVTRCYYVTPPGVTTTPAPTTPDPCSGLNCGLNAACRKSTNGVAECRCNFGFARNTDSQCVDSCSILDCDSRTAVCRKDDDGIGVCRCLTGFTMNNNECVDVCDLAGCDENANCIKDNDGEAECQCKAGFVKNNDDGCVTPCEITQCGINTDCANTDGEAICTCKTGYIRDTNNNDICSQSCGQVICDPNASCVDLACICKDGFEKENGICKSVCVLGQRYVTDTRACEACPEGTYGQLATQGPVCMECPSGESTRNTGSIGESSCIDQCSAGEQVNANDMCESCPFGTYKTDQGFEPCTNCPDGTTTSQRGATSSTRCVNACSAGQFLPTGDTQCVTCPVGTYSEGGDVGACQDCPLSLSTVTTGSISSANCTVEGTSVESIEPSYGPLAGGTVVTIYGQAFSAEDNPTVSLGTTECVIVSRNDTTLVCTTGSTSDEGDRNITLQWEGSDAKRTYIVTFTYLPDPIVVLIEPLDTVVSGGTLMTVTGEHLDSVARPFLIIQLIHPNNDIMFTSKENCTHINNTMLTCRTPRINLTEDIENEIADSISTARKKRDLYQNDLQLTHSDKQKRDLSQNNPHLSRTIFSLRMPKRMRRQTNEEPDPINEKSKAKFAAIVIFDGLKINYTEDSSPNQYPNVYADPTMEPLSEGMFHRAFWPIRDTQFEIKAAAIPTNLRDQVIILVGNEPCQRMEVSVNQVVCYPPSRRPEEGQDSQGNSLLKGQIGFVTNDIGTIRIENNLWEYTPGKIGILTCSIGLVVIIIIIVIIIVKCRTRSRRDRKPRGRPPPYTSDDSDRYHSYTSQPSRGSQRRSGYSHSSSSHRDSRYTRNTGSVQSRASIHSHAFSTARRFDSSRQHMGSRNVGTLASKLSNSLKYEAAPMDVDGDTIPNELPGSSMIF